MIAIAIAIAVAALLGHGIGYGVGYFRGHRVATEQADRQVNAMAERLGYTVPAAGPGQLHIPSEAA